MRKIEMWMPLQIKGWNAMRKLVSSIWILEDTVV